MTDLSFPVGGLTVGFGSLWVSDYYGNALWRLSPNGRLQAKIPTGLQPESVHLAFGSVWVSDIHGHSVTRIDPAADRVVATVPAGAPNTFRHGPEDLTDDGQYLYVGSRSLQKLQKVDPTTNTTSTPTHRAGSDLFRGEIKTVDGWIWSVDTFLATAYQLDPAGGVHATIDFSPGAPEGITVLGGVLWLGDDHVFDPNTFTGSHATLDGYNPRTGAIEQQIRIGGDAKVVRAGFGDLWVFDAVRQSLRRVHIG